MRKSLAYMNRNKPYWKMFECLSAKRLNEMPFLRDFGKRLDKDLDKILNVLIISIGNFVWGEVG